MSKINKGTSHQSDLFSNKTRLRCVFILMLSFLSYIGFIASKPNLVVILLHPASVSRTEDFSGNSPTTGLPPQPPYCRTVYVPDSNGIHISKTCCV